MSAPFVPPSLMFSNIVKPLRTTFETFADPRRGKNTRYPMLAALFQELHQGGVIDRDPALGNTLAPEFVQPQEGAAKQDCELNAAKRWLARWASHYAPLGMTGTAMNHSVESCWLTGSTFGLVQFQVTVF